MEQDEKKNAERDYERKTLKEIASGALTAADTETAQLWLKIAVSHITELEALVADAREVVKPFVPAANDWNEMGDSRPINMWQVDNRGDYPVTVGMLRRAAALSTKLEAQG